MSRVTLERLLEHLNRLKRARDARRHASKRSAAPLNGTIHDLRERGVDPDRAAATAALAAALAHGVVTGPVATHLRSRPGLVA